MKSKILVIKSIKVLQQFNQVIIIMGVYNDGKKLVVITEPKSICINLLIKINKSPEHDIEFIVSRNEPVTEYTTKNNVIYL